MMTAVVYYNNKVFIGRTMHIVVRGPRRGGPVVGRTQTFYYYSLLYCVYAGQV